MRPQRWPIYYGWVIVGVAFLGSGIGSGVAIWGASVFVIPMADDLGWNRGTFFTAFTVRSALLGLASPVVGPLFDTRNGPRMLAVGSAVTLGVSMALLRYTDHLWQFILLYGVFGGLSELGGGFAIAQTIVPKWFVEKRGRALGISTMGVGLGALIFPGAISALVGAVGWRDGWLWFGAAVGAVSMMLALLVRTRPEDVGLLPDGAPHEARHVPERTSVAPRARRDIEPDRSLTRHEAIRTLAFWMLLISSSFIALGIMGFQSNWLPFLLESGFGPAEAAAGIAVYGLVSGLSRPGWGLLGEHVPPRYLLAGSAAFTAVIIIFFLGVRSVSLLSAYMAIAGLSMGGYVILQTLLTADYFGRAHLGAVSSMFRPFMMVTSALSPLLVGILYDLRDDYTLAFLLAAAAWLIGGAFMLLARPPARWARAAVAGRP